MQNNVTVKKIFFYILKIIRPFYFAIFIMFLVSFIWAIDLSVRPYLLKLILNRLIDENNSNIFEHLFVPIFLYLFMYFITITSFRLHGYFVEIKMIPHLRNKIANESLELLINKSHDYYQNIYSGSLGNKVSDLINCIPEIIQIVIDRFFSHFLALIIAIFTLWQVSDVFGIFMICWTILFICGSLFFSKSITNLADNWSECGSMITGKIVDMLSNILSVRLFATKFQEKKSLAGSFQKAVDAEQSLQWSYFWLWFFCGYSFFILQLVNFYLLIVGREKGLVTTGDFALVLVINISIIDCLWVVGHDFSQFSKSLGRITQAFRSIMHMADTRDAKDAKDLVVNKGEIIFDKVKFHYKDMDAIFENKSIIIKPGQKVGLVGHSGSGKSTFVNLILRLYDVTDGNIFIDGQDISQVTQSSLHKNIAMIPQDTSLFHRTLMENIRYGDINATDEEVIYASKKAYAHEFITAIPESYGALVGERGIKISGGQRQRISIARAILKNAPILILDEATSQLDSITETYIQESLWELMQGKTTIIIAHRLSTLLHMDRILVFEQGKIIQDGSHFELLNVNGLYKTLWNSQVGGFLSDNKAL